MNLDDDTIHDLLSRRAARAKPEGLDELLTDALAPSDRRRRSVPLGRAALTVAVAAVLVAGSLLVPGSPLFSLLGNPPQGSPAATPSAIPARSPMPISAPSPLPDWTSLTWTEVDGAPFGNPGDQVLGGVRWAGGYVLGGTAPTPADGPVQGAIWVSPDGAGWTRIPDTGGTFDAAAVESIAARGSTIVAVGDRLGGAQAPTPTPPIGLVWISTDAVHWRRVAEADPTIGAFRISGVVAGPDGFVAHGGDPAGNPAIFFSSDGVQWQRVAATDPAFAATRVVATTATASSFIAVGSHDVPGTAVGLPGTAAAWWSSDGRVWHPADVGSGGYALQQVQPWAAGSVRAIGSSACGGCVGVAIDWRSTDDGRTWRPLPGTLGVAPSATSALLVDGRLVELQVGSAATARWTANGRAWTSLAMTGTIPPDPGRLEVAGDGRLIAVAPSGPSAAHAPTGMRVFLGVLR